MSKTLKKNFKRSSNTFFEDGYHSKQNTKEAVSRKQLKKLENALRSRDLNKILTYEDQL
jgi:hypothetical protein